MARKPAKIYRRFDNHAYTRKEFMRGTPQPKITMFEHGIKKDYPYRVSLVAKYNVQVTHAALESIRVTANKILSEGCGAQGYFMKIRPYPHHILKEHRQAVGAGADRVSQGMRHAFGTPVGTAARVRKNQIIIEVQVYKDGINVAKEALRRANIKLPAPCRIVIKNLLPESAQPVS